MQSRKLKDLSIIFLLNIAIVLVLWLPHILSLNNFYNLDFSNGFNTIFRNYDGIEYIIIAKSGYNPQIIQQLPQQLPSIYYAAHFPGYSLLILAFAPLLGFLKSMLFVSWLFTLLSSIIFYLLIVKNKLSDHPLFLSFLFLVLPARWLIVHSVGSSEPVFIFFILNSIYFFMDFVKSNKFKFLILAGILGLFAQITRPPGILLFISYGIYMLYVFIKAGEQSLSKRFGNLVISSLPLLLIPLGLILIFYQYSQSTISYGDFWAYFHTGDNIHLTFPPFQVFDKNQPWVGDIWLEDIVYILLIGFAGALTLWKKGLYPMSFFVFVYMIASSMVVHRDISRYVLPVFPFILIAFEKFLTSKEFKIVTIILLLAIYLYSQNYILSNTAPIPNPVLFD